MHIRELNNKNICILGHGREGQAAERAIKKYAPDAKIMIRDQKGGPDYLENLDQFDVIIKSPGIPPQPEFEPVREKMTNGTQIFLDSVHATVIGVTGSKGKSTTASLIHAILKAAGKDAYLIGNIGNPALDYIPLPHRSSDSKIAAPRFSNRGYGKSGDPIFVMELSSYQLMDLTVSPHIAVITSFFPEHLDYHGSLESYKEAKSHITKFQKKNDAVFYYEKSDGAREIAECSAGTRIPYSAEDSPVAIIDTNLIGTHNLFNIAGAWKAAEYLDVPKETAIKTIRTFKGLPHRLQSLGIHRGIEWIDDSISTTPDSTIAAIEALGGTVGTLILSGKDRGLDFSELKKAIGRHNIGKVIVMGEISKHFPDAIHASSMQEAVASAGNSVVLLSPAAPSYDQFANFEERGSAFARAIHNPL